MSRWGRHRASMVAAVAVSVLVSAVVGCTGSGDDAAEPADRGDPPDLVEPVSPDEVGSVTVDVEHVRIDLRLAGAVGDVLLAYDEASGHRSVVGSADLGATWAPLDLPGAPPDISVLVHVVEGVAVVGGVETLAPGRAHMWTSSDGRTWQGGAAKGTIPVGGVREVKRSWRQDDGGYLALVQGLTDDIVAVVHSADGASWQVEECPAASMIDAVCTPVETVGDLSFTAWEGTVSLDGGRDWQPPTLEPDPTDGGTGGRGSSLRSAVELAGGGWLGTADLRDAGFLVRSDDGTRWEQLISPDPCEAGRPAAAPRSWYWGPVPLGDGWLVGHGCSTDNGPGRSELYLLDAAGRNPRSVEGSRLTEPDLTYGALVAVGDAVIVSTERSRVPTGNALVFRP